MRKLLFAGAAVAALFVTGTAMAAEQPKQGGAAIVTFNNDLTTLDPQVGYDWQNWSVIKSIFDGLMDYKPGTTELEPDLAESYTVSDDGLTYTFKLRDGVKFHNGRVMTAADVKYSLERAVNPATQSPGGGYFSAIAGYDDMVGGKSTEMSGVARHRRQDGDHHAYPPRCHLPASHGHQLRLRRAEGRGREGRRRLGQGAGRHRRLQVRRMGAGPATSCSSATRTTFGRAFPISTS